MNEKKSGNHCLSTRFHPVHENTHRSAHTNSRVKHAQIDQTLQPNSQKCADRAQTKNTRAGCSVQQLGRPAASRAHGKQRPVSECKLHFEQCALVSILS